MYIYFVFSERIRQDGRTIVSESSRRGGLTKYKSSRLVGDTRAGRVPLRRKSLRTRSREGAGGSPTVLVTDNGKRDGGRIMENEEEKRPENESLGRRCQERICTQVRTPLGTAHGVHIRRRRPDGRIINR